MNGPLAELPKRSRRRFLGVIVMVVILAASAGYWGWSTLKPVYPYGPSHSCSKGLGLCLRRYAQDHGGWWPYGGSTPEESLSFVSTNGDSYGARSVLRGKHLPQSVVDAAFEQNGKLSPASCGWHYVEGLHENDSGELAVAWDKMIGLNHFGRFHKELQCEVVMLDGSAQHLSKKLWPEFCAKQKKLLAEAIANRSTNDPAIRWSDEKALGPNIAPPKIPSGTPPRF